MLLTPLSNLVPHFVTDNEVPLSGGKLSAFVAGTSTPVSLYDDIGTDLGSVITLDARGEPPTKALFTDASKSYKFQLQDASGVQVWSIDNIHAPNVQEPIQTLLVADSKAKAAGAIGVVQQIADYTALRALTRATGQQAVYIYSEGIAGAFRYDSIDTTTADDGGTVIVGADDARWKRAHNVSVKARWFGDDQAAIESALAVGPGLVDLGNLTWTLTSDLTLDVSLNGFTGTGWKLDASGRTTSGDIGLILAGSGDETTAGKVTLYAQNKNVVECGEIIGPGSDSAGIIGVALGQSGSTAYAFFTNLHRVAIHEFETGCQWGDNSFGQNFTDCNLYHCATAIKFPSGLTNAGERISFRGCTLFNNSAKNVSVSAGHMVFNQCSFDYTPRHIEALVGANVQVTGAHFEGNDDTDYWLYCAGSLSEVRISQSTFAIGDRSSFELGKSTSSDGGIHITDSYVVPLGSATYAFGYLIDGYGWGRNNTPFDVSEAQWVPSTVQNVLQYGGFENAGITEDNWTTSGGTDTSYDTAQKHSGSYSLKFSPVSNAYTRIIKNIDVRPGDKPRMVYWIKSSMPGSGETATFNVIAQYLNAAGGAILAPTTIQGYTASNAPGNWTLEHISATVPAPPGTTQAKFMFSYGAPSDVSSGSAAVWIDDVIICPSI